MKKMMRTLSEEFLETALSCEDAALARLSETVFSADRIFLCGAGRTRLMLQAFAMRLMQLGKTVYMVEDVLTPAITKDDLLLVGSGSGETQSVCRTVQKAKTYGTTTACVTANAGSTLAALCDVTVCLENRSKNALGATAFEAALLLLCDSIISHAIQTGITQNAEASLWKYHANLE